MRRRRRNDERESPESQHDPSELSARLATIEPEDADAPSLERASAIIGNQGVSRLAREGEGILADGRVHPEVQAAVAASLGRGRPLTDAARTRLAPEAGHDLPEVGIHDGPEAARLARSVSARAFTVGHDVFFGEGENRPGTRDGDALMAHELAHVAQDRGAPRAGALTVTRPGDARERDAEAGTGGAHGGPPALARKGKGAPVEVPGEVIVMEEAVWELSSASGGSVKAEIGNLIEEYDRRLSNTRQAMLSGMNIFLARQAFSASSEGEEDYSGTFLSFALEKIVDKAIDKGAPMGTALAKDLLGKLSEERERAAKARGEAAVATFVAEHIEKVTSTFAARIGGLDRMKEELSRQYDATAAGEAKKRPKPKKGAPEPAASPYVFGDAAKMLKGLRAEIDAVHVPTPAEVLEEILEQWINQSAGKFRHTKGGGHYIDGRIEISMEMDWWGGTDTKTTQKPKAKLNAPRAPQVCDTLTHVLKGGRTINDLDIEKELKVKVEHIDAGFAWSNYYYWITFRYRDPKKILEVVRDSRPTQRDVFEAEPEVERLVRSKVDISRDMGLTEVEPGKSEHLKPW